MKSLSTVTGRCPCGAIKRPGVPSFVSLVHDGPVKRRLCLVLSLLALPLFAEDPAHWARVNGHRLYYETMGEGRPLLLLHGGGNSVHGSFAKQLDVFAKSYAIVAPEQLGQGHTPDA